MMLIGSQLLSRCWKTFMCRKPVSGRHNVHQQ